MTSTSVVRQASAQLGVSEVLDRARYPAEWPFTGRDFARQDETDDKEFYSFERFCFHIDERAVGALTEFYDEALRAWDSPAILDLCASHVSHFPKDVADWAGRRVALGMNEVELKANDQVDEYVVQDLNREPILPFEDNTFDVVTNVVSIDYLNKPLEVTREVARVLKPGGAAFFALSNRCFPTKAVDIWLRTNDLEHVFIVGCYFHYSDLFDRPTAVEISPNRDTVPWAGGTSQNEAYLAVVRAAVNK